MSVPSFSDNCVKMHISFKKSLVYLGGGEVQRKLEQPMGLKQNSEISLFSGLLLSNFIIQHPVAQTPAYASGRVDNFEIG